MRVKVVLEERDTEMSYGLETRGHEYVAGIDAGILCMLTDKFMRHQQYWTLAFSGLARRVTLISVVMDNEPLYFREISSTEFLGTTSLQFFIRRALESHFFRISDTITSHLECWVLDRGIYRAVQRTPEVDIILWNHCRRNTSIAS